MGKDEGYGIDGENNPEVKRIWKRVYRYHGLNTLCLDPQDPSGKE